MDKDFFEDLKEIFIITALLMLFTFHFSVVDSVKLMFAVYALSLIATSVIYLLKIFIEERKNN